MQISVFRPNTEKHGPEKTYYLETFHEVTVIAICICWICHSLPNIINWHLVLNESKETCKCSSNLEWKCFKDTHWEITPSKKNQIYAKCKFSKSMDRNQYSLEVIIDVQEMYWFFKTDRCLQCVVFLFFLFNDLTSALGLVLSYIYPNKICVFRKMLTKLKPNKAV